MGLSLLYDCANIINRLLLAEVPYFGKTKEFRVHGRNQYREIYGAFSEGV